MAICRTFTSAVALTLCATTALAQAPVNDECANATIVNLGFNSYDPTGATDSTDSMAAATCFVTTISQDVWFTFTPNITGNYRVETLDNGSGPYDTKLAVYGVTTCPAVETNLIDCVDDNGGPGFLSKLNAVPMTAGVPVLIRVGSFSAATTVNPLDLEIAFIPPLTNDDCANALVVTTGVTPFDPSTATDGTGLPLNLSVCDMGSLGDEQIYNDVWFSFTSPTTDFYDIASVDGGNFPFDSRLAVYDQASCPDNPALVIGCDDDAGPGLEALAAGVSLTAGSTYLIRLGSFESLTAVGPAALSITTGVAPPPGPVNDDCANATPITAFGTYAFDNTMAATDGGDLSGFCNFGAFGDERIYDDLWFAYTPTTGGCTYISTFGLAGFDTRIAIYNGTTCPSDPASVIACNDDEMLDALSDAPFPFEAGLDVNLTAGTTYLIRLGNFAATTQAFPGFFQIAAGPQADINNLSGAPQMGAPGCVAGPTFPDFCNGDGGDQMGCTDCPCGNNAPTGTIGGCLNSAGTNLRITASGDPSVSLSSGATSDLRIGAAGSPPGAFGILNSGNAVAPGNMANPCFGLNSGAQSASFDGLRCAIQNTRRHGGRSADGNGDTGVTNNPWGGEGGPTVGLALAFGSFAAGETRYFQVINRDDPLAVCQRGLNTSQAVEVTFTP